MPGYVTSQQFFYFFLILVHNKAQGEISNLISKFILKKLQI